MIGPRPSADFPAVDPARDLPDAVALIRRVAVERHPYDGVLLGMAADVLEGTTKTTDRRALVVSIETALFAPLTEQRWSTLDDRLRPLVRRLLGEWVAATAPEGAAGDARHGRCRKCGEVDALVIAGHDLGDPDTYGEECEGSDSDEWDAVVAVVPDLPTPQDVTALVANLEDVHGNAEDDDDASTLLAAMVALRKLDRARTPAATVTTAEVIAWHRARFGGDPADVLVMGKLAEEAGEVCGAITKRAEGAVRPAKGLVTREGWSSHLLDEVGDVGIVLHTLCAREGTTLDEVVTRRFRDDVSLRTGQEQTADGGA